MTIKAVVFGCQQIAVDCIETLLEKGVEVPQVVTYELPLDKVYGYKSVQDFAVQHQIPCDMPEQLSRDFIDGIASLAPDVIFSFYYRERRGETGDIYNRWVDSIPFSTEMFMDSTTRRTSNK